MQLIVRIVIKDCVIKVHKAALQIILEITQQTYVLILVLQFKLHLVTHLLNFVYYNVQIIQIIRQAHIVPLHFMQIFQIGNVLKPVAVAIVLHFLGAIVLVHVNLNVLIIMHMLKLNLHIEFV